MRLRLTADTKRKERAIHPADTDLNLKRDYLLKTLPTLQAKRHRLQELNAKAASVCGSSRWVDLEAVLLHREIQHEEMGAVIRNVNFSSRRV